MVKMGMIPKNVTPGLMLRPASFISRLMVSQSLNEAKRICSEDLNELITAFVQDTPSVERGIFDEELVPEELTQVRMGKIVGESTPSV